jgi:hypothetical protein
VEWIGGEGTPPGPPPALLLPTYDESLVAYRSLRQLRAGSADNQLLDRPALVNGRAVGTWKRRLDKQRVLVEVTLWESVGEAARRAVAREAERYGRFLGLAAELELRS